MNIEEQIIDMLSGELSQQEQEVLLASINKDPEAQETYNRYRELNRSFENNKRTTKLPSERLKANVLDLIKREKASQSQKLPKGRLIKLTVLQKVASIAAMLIVGLLITQQYYNNNYRQETNQELAILKRQIDNNINSNSVSTRIKAVNYSKELPSNDPSILDLIISTAENDKNSNVRLAAVQALGYHLSAANVPEALGHLLITENDPIVKIAVIEIVSKIKSKDIVRSLENLTRDQDIPQYVKDEAHNSMTILQHGEIF